jgi:hypothetical protein
MQIVVDAQQVFLEHVAERMENAGEDLGPQEWRLPALAKELRMDRKKLRGWVACGWVTETRRKRSRTFEVRQELADDPMNLA